jgi:hypothetical protein
MATKLPRAVHLPSGQIARLDDAAAARARAGIPRDVARPFAEARAKIPRDVEGPFAEALFVLESEGVLQKEGGGALDVSGLSVRDFHVLRALLARAGHVREEAAPFTCENCGAPFEAAPSSLLEAAPFVDGELSDPELDAPFPFGEALPIPRIVLPSARVRGRRAAGSRVAETVTFAERTVEEARSLFRTADALIAGRARSLRITPAVVLGMGVVALGGERRTPVIAEALASAPNAAWAKVVEHWHDAAYVRRLFGLFRCEACGARNDLDVPLARELEREPLPRTASRKDRPPFPDLDAFQAMVEAHAAAVYAERGVRNIDLFVDAGVPHTDDGGEPLLGSYLPGGMDEGTGIPRPPEVRIYYRTFESEHRADPDFDVDAEIRETIDHEIEHHLYHLAGVDPMDEEERATIEREEIRRIGVRETARRGRQAVIQDLTGFLRTAWPLWLALLIAGLITWWSRQ